MSIAVGSVIAGIVTGITKFGAFVDIGEGKTGLVHISEVADAYVKDVNDYLKVKDKVEVKIINIEDNGKIGLSIRQAKPKAVSAAPAKQDKERKPSYPRKEFRQDRGRRDNRGRRDKVVSLSFEDKLSKFLKDSDEVQQSLKLTSESRKKRGRSGGNCKEQR